VFGLMPRQHGGYDGLVDPTGADQFLKSFGPPPFIIQ